MVMQSSASPGLAELIAMGVENILNTVHTSMPGKVVSYDATHQTAVVQPTLQVNIGGVLQSLPPIHGVPVCFPSTASAWILLPVAPGDQVTLHFSEASLDRWKQGAGDPTATGTPHRFNLSDAIAVPGLRPTQQAITPKGAATSIEITNGNGWLEVTPDGRFKASNGTNELLSVLDTILGHLIGLSTTNAAVGVPCALSPATITQLTADRTNLGTLKA